MGNLHKNMQLMLEFLKSPFKVLHFSYYTLMTFLMILSVILLSIDLSKNTGVIDVKMDRSVLEEKSSFKMLGLTFSSKLDCGCYIIWIAKTASRKIGVLICSMKFLSLEFALHLYKSTIKYYCHVLAGAPSRTCNCWISYRNEYAGLLVLHVMPLTVEM